ncbi:hypothetical protein BDP27DRAFT_1311288 [Rhodocollybia butyracea]|uniref:Uncharacterized protein n=1 Tax=Rhodocollybia butyracea TaxID=206335 RepID=A0A9P5Q930_9AGAR|nr:hypothetical protein BDP27DRAFT_1311288 [Rhodocollybia butyracea]
MSHDVHHAQDKSHPQYQVQVHYGADPNQIYSYTTTVEHDSRSGHPAYSSEYPSSNLRQETSQDDGVNSYAHQSGSLHAENSSHVEYNHNMENIHHDAHMQTVIDPLPPPPLPVSDDSMPTLAECEVFLTKLSFFANKGPGQGILTLRRREWLRKLKVAFFEAGSGIPITPDSDEEAE